MIILLGEPRVLGLPRYRVPRLLSLALPRTASFQLGPTAYRVFSTRPYRVPRLFSWTLPHTAFKKETLQKRTTTYHAYFGTYRVILDSSCQHHHVREASNFGLTSWHHHNYQSTGSGSES